MQRYLVKSNPAFVLQKIIHWPRSWPPLPLSCLLRWSNRTSSFCKAKSLWQFVVLLRPLKNVIIPFYTFINRRVSMWISFKHSSQISISGLHSSTAEKFLLSKRGKRLRCAAFWEEESWRRKTRFCKNQLQFWDLTNRFSWFWPKCFLFDYESDRKLYTYYAAGLTHPFLETDVDISKMQM